MNDNPKKLIRFFSEQYQNYKCMPDDGSKIVSKAPIPVLKILQKDFLRQISKEARKTNSLEKETPVIVDLSQQPTFLPIPLIDEEEENINPHTTIDIENTHSKKETTSQRLRWNLLFNILLWIVVPFPLWIPFVSNTVAIYALPSIQALFVSMWIGKRIK